MDFQKSRQELQDVVIANKKHVVHENVKKLVPDLRIDEEDDWLIELVSSQNPYDVLEACFAPLRLGILAIEIGLDPDQHDLKDRQLLSAILKEYGFTPEVTPSGITQIQQNLNNYLDAVYNSSSTSINIADIVDMLRTTIARVLNTIFLFYTYYLTDKEGMKSTWIEIKENGNNIRVEQEEPSNAIKELHHDYCTTAKTFGSYISFIRRLCLAIKNDSEVLQFHQRNFRRDTPLNLEQLSELAIFVAYRNIIEHRDDPHNTYKKNEGDVTKTLEDMSDQVRKEWQSNWNRVVNQYNQDFTFPLDDMVKRMSDFVRKFLSELCVAPRVYPRVIVMRSRTIDDYGTHQISAVDDSDETIFLTDCEFKPFIEYYYHSRTNPIGIEPLHLTKEELENWSTPPNDNTENQEEA